MLNPFRARPLSRDRVIAAMLVALVADGLQFMGGPVGWFGFDQVVDVVAMLLISLLIGFHPLLLPTFVVEFIPIIDMLPTWTGCVTAVILLKRRLQPPKFTTTVPPPTRADESSRVIDV